ncbi:unnamed protein product, partial [Polarella glacialis]
HAVQPPPQQGPPQGSQQFPRSSLTQLSTGMAPWPVVVTTSNGAHAAPMSPMLQARAPLELRSPVIAPNPQIRRFFSTGLSAGWH